MLLVLCLPLLLGKQTRVEKSWRKYFQVLRAVSFMKYGTQGKNGSKSKYFFPALCIKSFCFLQMGELPWHLTKFLSSTCHIIEFSIFEFFFKDSKTPFWPLCFVVYLHTSLCLFPTKKLGIVQGFLFCTQLKFSFTLYVDQQCTRLWHPKHNAINIRRNGFLPIRPDLVKFVFLVHIFKSIYVSRQKKNWKAHTMEHHAVSMAATTSKYILQHCSTASVHAGCALSLCTAWLCTATEDRVQRTGQLWSKPSISLQWQCTPSCARPHIISVANFSVCVPDEKQY